jgi:transcriptional regulator with XRE-family HTH domain
VRARRIKLGISQEDAADLAEMHVSNYGKAECGMANPSLHTILRLATALNIDPAKLIGGLAADMVPDRGHTVTAANLIKARAK